MERRLAEGRPPIPAEMLWTAGDPRPGTAARTILVVEDEWLVRDLIAREIEEAGYLVLESETAEQGLRLFEDNPVSLLFTDIRLPGAMSGWELAESVRRIRPTVPVIYATGYSAEQPRVVPGGIFLRKPYLTSQVIGHIGRLLDPDARE